MIPKFMAWLKDEKCMVNNIVDICFSDEQVTYEDEVDYHQVNFEDIILRQSTGLKDKNGKEIFEGDIVKLGNYIGEVDYYSSDACYVIWIKTELLPIPFYNFRANKDCEVIGNIYEGEK